MASGDKIYLADKETLDKVNLVVDGIESNIGKESDNTGRLTIFYYLKNILTSITSLINSSKNSSKSVPYSKVKSTTISIDGRSDYNYITLFDSGDNTPGDLYSVVVTGTGAMNPKLRIRIDDGGGLKTILLMSLDHSNASYAGLIVGEKLYQRVLGSSAAKTIVPYSREFSANEQTAGCVYSPVPIRANSRVIIDCTNYSSTTVYVEYTYIQD